MGGKKTGGKVRREGKHEETRGMREELHASRMEYRDEVGR